MRWALFALLLAGCGDSFEEPGSVDLSKNPYDFSVPTDGGGPDLSSELDLSGDDLSESPDLTPPNDLTQVDNPDLTQTD